MKDSVMKRANAGASIIVSSHLLELIEDICTHILIIDQGCRQYLGSIDHLREQVAQGGNGGRLEDAFFLITEGGAPPAETP